MPVIIGSYILSYVWGCFDESSLYGRYKSPKL